MGEFVRRLPACCPRALPHGWFPLSFLQSAWVARLEALFEDEYGDLWARCKWMYFPEETSIGKRYRAIAFRAAKYFASTSPLAAGRLRSHHEREVFSSDHIDDNTLDTITGRAVILNSDEWSAREAATPAFWLDQTERVEVLGSSHDGPSDSDNSASDDDCDRRRMRRETYMLRSHYDVATGQLRRLAHAVTPGIGGLHDNIVVAECSSASSVISGGATQLHNYVAAASTPPKPQPFHKTSSDRRTAHQRAGQLGARLFATGDLQVSDSVDGAVNAVQPDARRAAGAPRPTDRTVMRSDATDVGAPWALVAPLGGACPSSRMPSDPVQGSQPAAPATSAAEFAALCASAQSMLALSAVPASLPCRERERDGVRAFLESAIAKGGLGSALYISGMPGTGKTATVYEVVRDLMRAHAAGELPNFRFHEINAMRLASPYQAYSVLHKAITGLAAAPKRAAELLDAFFNRPSSEKQCHVVLVDELDFLVTRKQSVLYNLFDWPSRRHARLIVIGVANTMDLPERLLPKVHSRLGMGRIVFKPYTKDQITTIVSARLEGLPGAPRELCLEFMCLACFTLRELCNAS